jgi:hypothetical protein
MAERLGITTTNPLARATPRSSNAGFDVPVCQPGPGNRKAQLSSV